MNIVVSLMAEARPLIDRFRLHRLSEKHPFLIYKNETMSLIISGMGKIFSAAATAYLQALTRDDGPATWLNLGIAGHRDLAVGQGFIAHRVIDQATRRCYYPPLIHPFSCATSDLTTVDAPEKTYDHPGGYDMEASGYYQIALRSTTIEWVQCYKVVSDTPQHPVEKITKSGVMDLIASRLDEIETLMTTLSEALQRHSEFLIQDTARSTGFETITRRWHFTETQKTQLSKLLQRWFSLHREHFPFHLSPGTDTNAKILLADIEQRLSKHRISF